MSKRSINLADLPPRYQAQVQRQLGATQVPKHKFNAQPTEHNGRKYASKKEAKYAAQLELRQQAGEVLFWLEQVPFHLPGSTTYRVDFCEFHADGTVHFVDVKGHETDMFKLKKHQVEALFPVVIEVV